MAQDTQPSQPPQAHLEDTDAPYGCSPLSALLQMPSGNSYHLGEIGPWAGSGNHPQGAGLLRVGLRVLSAPPPPSVPGLAGGKHVISTSEILPGSP